MVDLTNAHIFSSDKEQFSSCIYVDINPKLFYDKKMRKNITCTDDSKNNYENGGWDSELLGIWVGKYETSLNSHMLKNS